MEVTAFPLIAGNQSRRRHPNAFRLNFGVSPRVAIGVLLHGQSCSLLQVAGIVRCFIGQIIK